MKQLTDVTTKVNNVITERTNYTYDNNGNQLTKAVKTYVEEVDIMDNMAATVITVTTEISNIYDLRNHLIRTQT